MIEVGLFDGGFTHQKSASLGGENTCEGSQVIQWVRNEYRPVTFFTDMHIASVLDAPDDITKVAWLIEPPSLSETHYHKALELHDEFDCILTFNHNILEKLPKTSLYYPFGGSWIPLCEFGLQSKSDIVSMITTDKQRAPGHKMRHKAAHIMQLQEHPMYGRGTGCPMESKVVALRSYCYSIVIESCKLNGYFSEKLIDCFSQGTVPIYWGAPDIGKYFDTRGMMLFEDMEQLRDIIDWQIGFSTYTRKIPYIQHNLKKCYRYRCAEDWIYRSYPYIFEPCEKNVTIS